MPQVIEPWIAYLATATCSQVPPSGVAGGAVVTVPLVVPMPSWPVSLAPQHQSVASLLIAQVWSLIAISVHCVPFGTFTGAGLSCGVFVLPMPSSPVRLSPQQYGTPPRIAHEEAPAKKF